MNALATILLAAAGQLAAAGIDTPRLDARVLLAHVLGVSPSELLLSSTALCQRLTAGVLARFDALVARRAAREPLAYITGEKEFWSLTFAVGPGVLIPRPETELMIELVQKLHPDRDVPLRVLDLGTGSGCILLTFLSLYPQARGIGVDISDKALKWARRNARTHGLAARAAFRPGNWAEGLDGPFDVVFANPPYIDGVDMEILAPEVGRHEPHRALKGGADGLDAYRLIAPQTASLLAPDGHALVEFGMGQSEAVAALFAAAGLQIEQIAPDLAGIPRNLVARRPERKRRN